VRSADGRVQSGVGSAPAHGCVSVGVACTRAHTSGDPAGSLPPARSTPHVYPPTHAYIHLRMSVHTYACVYTPIHVYTHLQMRIHTYKCVYTPRYAYTHIRMHIHIYRLRLHNYASTIMQAHTHLRMHIHTYACVYPPMHGTLTYTNLCMRIPTSTCIPTHAHTYPPTDAYNHLRTHKEQGRPCQGEERTRAGQTLSRRGKNKEQERPCQGEERTRGRTDLVKERKEQGAGRPCQGEERTRSRKTLSRRGKNKGLDRPCQGEERTRGRTDLVKVFGRSDARQHESARRLNGAG